MRVKRGTVSRRRHKKVLKMTKGQWGTRSKLFRRANESMMKSQWYAYRDRRVRRRDLRRLWIARINAASRQNGLSYSKFMHGLKLAEVPLDRKVLADIAVRDAEAFAEIAGIAAKALENNGTAVNAISAPPVKTVDPAAKAAEAEAKAQAKADAKAKAKAEKAAAAEAKAAAAAAAAAEAEASAEAEAAEAEVVEEAAAEEAPAVEASAPEAVEADDLKKIEGIGPKIAEVLNNNGIHTFAQLAAAEADTVKGYLADAGPQFNRHDPTTWGQQATLANNGEWEALEKLQDELMGGKAA